MSVVVYITSERPDSTYSHIGDLRELRGVKGTLFGTYYVTLCSGRKLGGPWGQMETSIPMGTICPRCQAIHDRRTAE